MDHLNSPKFPARVAPRFRYVARQDYDKKDFLTYPERSGWDPSDVFNASAWKILDTSEVLAFAQQWLFFGLLHTVFGDRISLVDCTDTEEKSDERYIHTRNLLSVAKAFMKEEESESSMDGERLVYLKACLTMAADVYDVLTKSEDGPIVDPYFAISLAAVGRFCLHVVDELEQDTFDLSRWPVPAVRPMEKDLHRFTDELGLISIFCLEMAKLGWCPRQVALAATLDFETQYFQSRLQQFEARQLDHQMCSQRSCFALQTSKETYHVMHTSPNCECGFVHVDSDKLESILQNGEIPLLTLLEDGRLDLLSTKFHPQKPSVYVAISHVWSDGLGNPSENALPLCQLRRFDEIIHGLRDIPKADGETTQYGSKIPFWIDTLCCPAKQSEAKKLAILRMRETYEGASNVLVLSADLQTINAAELPLIEQTHLVYLSAWASRLWTLQEAALPEQLCVKFKDTIMNYSNSYFHILEDCNMLNHGWINVRRMFHLFAHLRGTVFRDPRVKRAPTHTTTVAMSALTWRTTSVHEDEAICLASILGVDMALVLPMRPQERMKAIWTHTRIMPMSLVFWKGERMAEAGFRWAPRSLMGVLDSAKDYKHETGGKVTTQGLRVEAFDLILESRSIKRLLTYEQLLVVDRRNQNIYLLQKAVSGNKSKSCTNWSTPNRELEQVAILSRDPTLNRDVEDFTMVFLDKVDEGVTYASRGDSGQIFKNVLKSPVLSLAKTTIYPQGTNAPLSHIIESLEQVKLGDTIYGVVVGVWSEEARDYCID